MKVSLFEYHLPPDRIAQEPLPQRDASRLMVVKSGEGAVSHATFRELPQFVEGGTLMVVNNARVIPARLFGRRATGGKVEVFLVREREKDLWVCLVKPGRSLREGARVFFPPGSWWGEVEQVLPSGERVIRFWGPGGADALLESQGQVPLPPYIRRPPSPLDRERYQTIFAARKGAVAAPTAGLHFTPRVLDALKYKGVEIVPLTLHVGPGTFRPVKTENVEDHSMEEEYYEIPPQTADKIQQAKKEGRRLLAVGTTVTRALESAANEKGELVRLKGWTGLFIYPGYRFKVVNGLLTNFHLPRSTLLMLVCAFGGRELIMSAYREAIEKGYRFYSYGDAMLIL